MSLGLLTAVLLRQLETGKFKIKLKTKKDNFKTIKLDIGLFVYFLQPHLSVKNKLPSPHYFRESFLYMQNLN